MDTATTKLTDAQRRLLDRVQLLGGYTLIDGRECAVAASLVRRGLLAIPSRGGRPVPHFPSLLRGCTVVLP